MEPDLSRAVASGATDATVKAAGPVSADRPHGGAPAPAAPAAPVAQPAGVVSGEDAIAAAAQATPSNVNVSVRIFSPGNDGPVTQTNATGPVSVTTTTTAPSAPVSPAAGPVTVPPAPAVPTSWVWNWTWDSGAAGCASGAVPPASTSMASASTWTWNWVWRCAPALRAIPLPDLPGLMLSADAAHALASASAAGADDDAAVGRSSSSGKPVPIRRPGIRRSLATRERSDGAVTMWAALGAPPTGRGRGGADSGAETAPVAARVLDSTLTDLFQSGLTGAAAAAAATSGGSGISGFGVAAAALLAALVLFAPPLLIPLRAAAARRLPHVSARRDRPG